MSKRSPARPNHWPDDPALAVPCQRCGAWPFDPCVSRKGGTTPRPHGGRIGHRHSPFGRKIAAKWEIPCQKCGAEPGELCRRVSKQRGDVSKPHVKQAHPERKWPTVGLTVRRATPEELANFGKKRVQPPMR